MKTGILTFHNADSYGAVLQAYALSVKLMELGANPEFITIRRPEEQQAPVQLQNPLIRRIYAAKERRKENFAGFRKKRLVDERVCTEEESGCLNEVYDIFFAGSDQIWNFHIKDTHAGYLLPFAAPEKRYSYAASFGEKVVPEFARNYVAGELEKFRGLSVREPKDADIIAGLTGRRAIVCVDPTLLLSREDWEKLTVPTDHEEYVLLFMLQYSKPLLDKARDVASAKKLPLKIVTAVFMPQMGSEAWNINGVKVEEWLSLIHDAQCVLTNSYHGMVFSLLFERPLIAWKLDGPLVSRNGRIETLLRTCSGQKTGIGQETETGQEIRIPYHVLLENIKDVYERSVCYLETAVKDVKS